MIKNRGWFHIPGVQEGDRTLEEQLLGLAPALQEAQGKTVCDLGCAEGLIAIEFASAGAAAVYGCDYNVELLATAQQQIKDRALPIHFEFRDLNESRPQAQSDIVLALAVLHKLDDPAAGVRLCAALAKQLIVLRLPIGSRGIIKSKHKRDTRTDIGALLLREGFRRERKEPGPRGEWVQYWRRHGLGR
jgi:predicted RNA methylase